MPTRKRVAWETPFLNALRAAGVVTAACRAANVSRNIAYRRRSQNEAFRAAWDAAIEESLDSIELAIMKVSIEGTDMQTARWVLSRRRPDVWGDKQDIQVSGPGGGPIEVDQSVHLPDPDTWAEIARIRAETEESDDT